MIKRSILFLNMSLFLNSTIYSRCILDPKIDPAQIEYPDSICAQLKVMTQRYYLQNATLLRGKPGVGKSYVASLISNSIGAETVIVRCPDLVGKYAGTASDELKKTFEDVKKRRALGKRVVVVFEEVDAIAGKITDSNQDNNNQRTNAIQSLWLHLDDYNKEKGSKDCDAPYFIFTTNHPENLDLAFMSRMSKVIEIKDATKEQRLTFLKYLIGKYNLSDALNEQQIKDIANTASDLSFRDLDRLAIFIQVEYIGNNKVEMSSIKKEINEIKAQAKKESQAWNTVKNGGERVLNGIIYGAAGALGGLIVGILGGKLKSGGNDSSSSSSSNS